MRFERLDLVAFGPFTDTSIRLTAANSDLHIVYGPNEAGKTAALKAIVSFLYGFPAGVEDDYVHAGTKLRVGAHLVGRAGGELVAVRRRGRKGTLLDPRKKKDATYPDDVLDAFLVGMDRTTFTTVCGIGHADLVAGGRTLERLKGLLGDSLFAAGLGGPQLQSALQRLEAECEELYAPSRQLPAITSAIGRYHKAVADRDAAAASEHAWRDAVVRQIEAEKARAELQAEIDALQARERRVARLLGARQAVVERERARATLAELGPVTPLPQSYSAADRSAWQRRLEAATADAERIDRELDGPGGIRALIAGMDVPRALIERATSVASLFRRVEEYRTGRKDVERTLAPRREQLLKRCERLVAECGLGGVSGGLDGHRVPPTTRAAVDELALSEGVVHEKPRSLEERISALEAERGRQQAELAALGEPQDAAALVRAVEAGTAVGDLDAQIDAACAELEMLTGDAGAALERLGLGRVAVEAADGLPVPAAATIDTFDAEYGALKAARDRLAERGTEAEAAKFSAAERLRLMAAEKPIATLDDLAAARRRRDELWRLVKSAWRDGAEDAAAVRVFAGAESLADAYERSVVEADRLADELRNDAGRIAEAGALRARLAAAEETLLAIANERSTLEKNEREIDGRWRAAWERIGLAEAASPKEMREWREGFRDLAQLVEGLRHRAGAREALASKRAELVRDLAAAARDLALPEVPDTERLAPALARGRAALEAIEQAGRTRDALREAIGRAEADLAGASRELGRSRAVLEEWRARWVALARAVGCDASASPAAVRAKIASLDGLFGAQDELLDVETRIAGIEKRGGRFETDALELASALALDLAGRPADAAVVDVHERLSAAQQAATRVEGLRDQERAAAAKLRAAETECAAMESRLNELCALAGVEDVARLADAEDRSRRCVEATAALASNDDTLRTLFGGDRIEQSIAEAKASDPERLEGEGKELVATLERRRGALSRLDTELGELETALRAFDGRATAADADQTALECLAEVGAKTAAYVRLRLAGSVLRAFIDRQGDDGSIPLLVRAGELFARITCGAFRTLATELDDRGDRFVVGLRHGDDALTVEQMSDGTRDQLYLALRLAYVEQQFALREPMPFVVDDILVTFDDDRALATLEVLAELAERTQVVFFTHHRHLGEIAARLVGDGRLVIHELPGRFEREGGG